MWPVPEVLLGVLAILIVIGFLSGPSRARNLQSDTKSGARQAAGVSVTEQQGTNSAAGNTSGQAVSAPGASRELSAQPKRS